MQVACPSCSAEYPVNERRLPATGLKMRCPKCGARFHVHPDGRAEPADAAPAAPAKTFGKPAPAVPKPDLDLDLPAPKGAAPSFDLDLPAPRAAVPKPAAPALDDDLDLDLPAPRAAVPKPAAPAPSAMEPLGDDFELDLPIPKAAPPAKKPLAPPVDVGKPAVPSLPKPAAASPTVPAKKPIAPPVAAAPTSPAAKKPLAPPVAGPAAPAAAKKPLAPPVDLDLDLPAPKAAEAPRAKAGLDLDDLDLPGPRAAAKPKPAPELGDLDLPAPRAAKPEPSFDLDLDLPAPRAARPADDLDLDLPAPRPSPGAKAKPAAPDLDLDLPAPRAARPAADLDLDLPAPRRGAGPGADLDLPAPRAGAAKAKAALEDSGKTPFDDLDLPTPKSSDTTGPRTPVRVDDGFGELDLPMPRASDGFGDLDLPMPKAGAVDLPAPKGGGFGDLDLPTPKVDADLPGLKGGGFGDLDLPIPKADADLPTLKGGGFGDLDLPIPKGDTDLPIPRGGASDGFGDLELPEPRALSDFPGPSKPSAPARGAPADFGDLELPEPRASLPPALTPEPASEGRGKPGGTGFGELDFGEAGDDMEFADIPQREGAAPDAAGEPASAPRVVVQKKAAPKAPKGPPRKGRAVLSAAIVLGVLLAAGAALAFTPYGLFGVHFFEQFMPGAGDPAVVRATITRAEEQARPDGYWDLRASLTTLGRVRRDAGLNRELLARSLVHESLFLIRFGNDSASASRASAIRSRLEERSPDAPEVALGIAADALRLGQLPTARARLAQARSHAANDPYVHLVAGELALVEGDLDEAASAFALAVQHGAGPRGLWGTARARLAGEDRAAALAAVEAVLAENPVHAEALVTRAEIHFDAGELDPAVAIAEKVAGRQLVDGARLQVSRPVRARALTVLGRVDEARGRTTRALAAYDQALEAHDAHVPALLGAGRVLLADRPTDARTRFDAVMQAAAARTMVLASGRTALQEAQLGAARANLALDQPQEAITALTALAAERADDAEVLLYLGHAERQRDPPDDASAEQHFRAAIGAAPDQFPAYVALAELFFETDRTADAGGVLEQAASRVPESAEVRLALGNFELRRDRMPAAIEHLRRALELDPDLPAAHFALGVAQRRSGRLDDAAATFERLARIDPRHPRLALERGLLFEARGESARAVEAYQAAWNENQDDMDLLLRLGAAQVAANQMDAAEATLERVRQSRPSSAEAAHFMGRVAFARGRHTEALTHFREAVRLDRTRGEFHMYVAWAALENNQLGEALASADAAIERDSSLGEAYWVRGVVRLRSGNPLQALTDCQEALRLRPSLHRAHATMGEAYEELGRLNEAVAAFERGVARDDSQGQWWWRLGRIRMDRGDRRGAAQALGRATLLGDATSPLPGWLAAAHRFQAEALRLDGQRAESIRHYRRYLELAPPGDIDREDVERILQDLGAP
jgi:predicted Zn finger-like uncharacterized protein